MPIYVNIKKSLGNFFLNVEFEAEDCVVGLLGASGCGKSMTLSCVAGIVRPDEGKIVVNGVTFFDSEKRINLPPQKRKVGLLFQNCALFPNMTVEQNILCVLSRISRMSKTSKNRGAQGAAIAERLALLTEKFYLRGLENHYPAQLSGGQKQRAALARILAGEPSLLMLDEPLSALDSYLRWQLEGELLETLEEFEGAALYVSHSRDEVYRLCDRVCVINAGRSEKIRTVKELFEFPDTLASALLSGCKNFSRAEKIDARTVRALDWGVDLACGSEVSDEICYIGVRVHHIGVAEKQEKTGKNIFPCRVLRVIEDVFSTVVNLEPIGLSETSLSEVSPSKAELPDARGRDFSRIRIELPKQLGKFEKGDTIYIEIDPNRVMLLKE